MLANVSQLTPIIIIIIFHTVLFQLISKQWGKIYGAIRKKREQISEAGHYSVYLEARSIGIGPIRTCTSES